jgi:tetratricopeptide (TPR) repeat protein
MRAAFRAIGVLLLFAVPIYLFASPNAASALILVTLAGLLIGLLVQVVLSRRRTGVWRLTGPRRRPYLVPADLPPPPGLLIGRDGELAEIRRRLTGERPGAEGPATVTVTGVEGVGKTALAVTAAHLVVPHFKHGQILVRFDTQRRDGNEHARGYLTRALIGPGEDEPGEAEFDRWYRRRTSGNRRVLVVLDNVPHDVDVARFTPAGRFCALIVTSREPLDEVPAEARLRLDPLGANASAALFDRLLGPDAAGAEPGQAARLVAAARGFPAALQMAGAVVRARRSWDLEAALDDVRLPDSADAPPFVAVLALAGVLLTEQERSCLTLLALLDRRRVAPWMLVALARGAFPDWTTFDETDAGLVLDRLARVRFIDLRVDEKSGVVVYRVPRYVRQYARLLLDAEVGPDGTRRAKDSFAVASRLRLERRPEEQARLNVYHLLDGGQLDEVLDAAREALHLAQDRRRAVVDRASAEADAARRDEALAEAGLAEVFAELGWIDEALTAALSADRSNEVPTRIRSLRVQGRIRWRLRQSAAAIERLDEAKRLAEAGGLDLAERIRVLRELTVAQALSPNPALALPHGAQALALCRDHPDTQSHREPSVLWAYGIALTANRRHAEAAEVLGRGDTLSGKPELGQGLWRPWIRHQRAYLALQEEQYDTARGLAASALEGFTSLIHRYGSGHSRLIIGRAYLAEQNLDRAVPALEEALQTFERCGDRWIEADASYWLGLAYAGRPDRADEAESMLRDALFTYETLKDFRSANDARVALRERDTRDRIFRSVLGRRGDRHAPVAP